MTKKTFIRKITVIAAIVGQLGYPLAALAQTPSNGSANAAPSKAINYTPTSGQVGGYNKIAVPPDFMNYDKFNVARECSPAEKYAGKTSCNVCDADTPNVRLPYNEKTSRIVDAVITSTHPQNPYLSDKYRNAWSQKTTSSKRVLNLLQRERFSTPFLNNRHQQDYPAMVILHGYNLTGYAWGEKGENAQDDPTSMYPLNMRTKCETFKPKYKTYQEAVKNGDNTGFRGAAYLALGAGGMVVSAKAIEAFTNPAGNKGAGAALGGSAAAGATANAAKAAAAGLTGGEISRRAFICLEYHTSQNGVSDNGYGIGGRHILGNTQHNQDCVLPLAAYYSTFVPEIPCPPKGYPCDGVPDGVHSHTTRTLRYLFLLRNPSILQGRTMAESLRIVKNRPLTGFGFP